MVTELAPVDGRPCAEATGRPPLRPAQTPRLQGPWPRFIGSLPELKGPELSLVPPPSLLPEAGTLWLGSGVLSPPAGLWGPVPSGWALGSSPLRLGSGVLSTPAGLWGPVLSGWALGSCPLPSGPPPWMPAPRLRRAVLAPTPGSFPGLAGQHVHTFLFLQGTCPAHPSGHLHTITASPDLRTGDSGLTFLRLGGPIRLEAFRLSLMSVSLVKGTS